MVVKVLAICLQSRNTHMMVTNLLELYPEAKMDYSFLHADMSPRGKFNVLYYACSHVPDYLARLLTNYTTSSSFVFIPDPRDAELDAQVTEILDEQGYVHYGDTRDCAVFHRARFIAQSSQSLSVAAMAA